MKKAVNRFLKTFGKLRRPMAWVILFTGLVGILATLFKIIATGEAYWATLAGFGLLFVDGFQAVQEVEEDAESQASMEKQ